MATYVVHLVDDNIKYCTSARMQVYWIDRSSTRRMAY